QTVTAITGVLLPLHPLRGGCHRQAEYRCLSSSLGLSSWAWWRGVSSQSCAQIDASAMRRRGARRLSLATGRRSTRALATTRILMTPVATAAVGMAVAVTVAAMAAVAME